MTADSRLAHEDALLWLHRAEEDFAKDAVEIGKLDPAEWDWRFTVVATARRRLRYKHDIEVMELARELVREAIEKGVPDGW